EEAPVEQESAPAETVEQPAAASAEPQKETAQETKSPSDDDTGSAPKAISKDDYVSPLGTTSSVIREMKPRASISDSGGKSARKAPKRPSLPSIAPMPNFKPSTPSRSKSEPAAQKPDLPLTADALKQ